MLDGKRKRNTLFGVIVSYKTISVHTDLKVRPHGKLNHFEMYFPSISARARASLVLY